MILFLQSQLVYAKNYYRTHADNYRNQFAQNSKDKTSKELLASYQGYEQLVSNEIIAQLLERNLDTAMLYLESSDLLEDKKLLAELFLFKGEYGKCRNTLTAIRSEAGLVKPALLHPDDQRNYPQENSEFIRLIELVLSIVESGKMVEEATDEEVAVLENISESGLAIAGKACAYLKQATGKECQFEVLDYVPDAEEMQKRLAIDNEEEFYMNLYPNPANDMITLKANITEATPQTAYNVYDLTGNLKTTGTLQEGFNEVVINTKDFAEGIYILQLRNLNAIIKARQFVVIK